MIALHIDTTSEYSLIHLLRDQNIMSRTRWQSEKKLGDDLLPKIMTLLKGVKVGLKDLNCITVNSGPGSFTGTRVGVSTANALAWSLDIPVFAVGSEDSILKSPAKLSQHFTKPVVPKYASLPKVTLRKI